MRMSRRRGLPQKFRKIIQCAEFGPHIFIIGNVIAIVDHGGWIVREEVQAIHAECREVIELRGKLLLRSPANLSI